MKFQIAIIKPTDFEFSIKKEELTNLVSEKIEFIEQDTDGLIEFIGKKLELDKNIEYVADTLMCYENYELIYQMCHLGLVDNGQKEELHPFNKFASFINIGKKKVYGDGILMCSLINKEKEVCTENVSVLCEDIVNIIWEKLHPKFIYVPLSGPTECLYGNTLLDVLDETENKDEYRSFDFPYFKFNLIVYHNPNHIKSNENINKTMTKLIGSRQIYGPAIIVAKTTETEYLNLPMKIFDKMLYLAKGHISSRKLDECEEDTDTRIDGLPVIRNRYMVLNKRCEKFVLKCGCCLNKMEKSNYICSGCYRIYYCNQECQKSDWKYHKKDCFVNKEK
jgi:hypothetical protein